MHSEHSKFDVAIDGPVSSGKGTVSRLVAERLGFLYVDTGATYRMAAWLALQNDVSLEDEAAVAAQIDKAEFDMKIPTEDEADGRLLTILLNGEDVSWKIRTEEVGQGASKVAALPEVRKVLVKKQQEIARQNNVIMEGRDIGSRVLPHAALKIYLTASDVVRAKRRTIQLQEKGQDVTFAQVYADLIERDKRDMERTTDPLVKLEEAWEIDTSDLSIEQVVEMIVIRVTTMMES